MFLPLTMSVQDDIRVVREREAQEKNREKLHMAQLTKHIKVL